MVISKKPNSLSPGKVGLYILWWLFFFFLEFHEPLKILHLTLFHHKDSDSFKNVMFFVGFVLCVVINVLFSQPWVSVTYFFYWKSSFSYWYWCLPETTAKAHSETTQTSKIELIVKIVNYWKSLSSFTKKLHRSCLTGLRKHLCIGTIGNRKKSWKVPDSQFWMIYFYPESLKLWMIFLSSIPTHGPWIVMTLFTIAKILVNDSFSFFGLSLSASQPSPILFLQKLLICVMNPPRAPP